MGKKLSEFCFENCNNNKIKEMAKENDITINNSDVENLSDIIDKYKNLSSEELMQNYISVIQKRKQNGEINKEEINNIKSTLYPLLTEEQKINLDSLLKFME